MQRIKNAIPGQTYNFRFGLSANITSFDIVVKKDDRSDIPAEKKLVSSEDKGKYNVYDYSITLPQNVDLGSEGLLFVGLNISGDSEGIIDGYIFDIGLWKADDENKSELLDNSDFSIGLDYWAWGYDAWFGFWAENPLGLYEWKNEYVELKLMDFDESLFDDSGTEIPETDHIMLYFNSSNSGPFMQRIKNAVPGETYTFDFGMTSNVKDFDIVVKTDERNDISAEKIRLKKEDKGSYFLYSYSITLPENIDLGPEGLLFIGLNLPLGTEGYIFDISLINSDDPEKKQIFSNADFRPGLDYWAWGYDAWFGFWTENPLGVYEWQNEYVELKLMDFDESLFGAVEDVKKMLYFKNGANSSTYASRITCVPGETYIMQYSVFSTDKVEIAVVTNGDRGNVEANAELLSSEDHGSYTTYKYQFTIPEDYNDSENLVFVGVNIQYYAEGFIFDMSCIRADDSEEKECFPNASLKVGLDTWIWGWKAWFAVWPETPAGVYKWASGSDEIEVMDFDESKIKELISVLNVDDGKWWSDEDIIEEPEYGTATVKGILTDENKIPMSGVKLVLESSENSYTSVTDSKGFFEFKDILTGFYELYIVDADGTKIPTNYYSTLEDGDIVNVTLLNSRSQKDDTSSNIPDDDKEEEEPTGTLIGTVYTPELKIVPDLKIYLRGVGDTVTDENGSFTFEKVPAGEYELYAIDDDGKEYIFRNVTIKENVELSVKLKYQNETENTDSKNETDDNSYAIWIIASVGAVLLVAAGTFLIILCSKKHKKKRM